MRAHTCLSVLMLQRVGEGEKCSNEGSFFFLEICDYGYPQNSEIDALKAMITTESVMSTTRPVSNNKHAVFFFVFPPFALRKRKKRRKKVLNLATKLLQEEPSKITEQATGVTSWRRGDVKYKKNEAFVDVVEVINLSMSAKGPLLLFSSLASLRSCSIFLSLQIVFPSFFFQFNYLCDGNKTYMEHATIQRTRHVDSR